MHAHSRRLVVGAALLASATILPLVAATDAGAADTTVTFTVAAGELDLTGPATTNLGSANPGASATGQLGPVTVTDQRALLTAGWTTSVSGTAFTTGGGTPAETVSGANVSYWSGPATATTGIGVFTPGQLTALLAQSLSSPRTAFTLALGVGNNSATWNPSLIVNVPSAAVAGVYSGTVTNSVA